MLFVAAIGIFCGYHVNWIRQRHALLAESNEQQNEMKSRHGQVQWGHGSPAHSSFSFLWLFGERQQRLIRVFAVIPNDDKPPFGGAFIRDFNDHHTPEMERAASLFPEADIELLVYSVKEQ